MQVESVGVSRCSGVKSEKILLKVFPLDTPFVVAVQANKGQCQTDPLLHTQGDSLNENAARNNDYSL